MVIFQAILWFANAFGRKFVRNYGRRRSPAVANFYETFGNFVHSVQISILSSSSASRRSKIRSVFLAIKIDQGKCCFSNSNFKILLFKFCFSNSSFQILLFNSAFMKLELEFYSALQILLLNAIRISLQFQFQQIFIKF